MEEAPQNWQMFAGLAVLIIGLFAWLRSDIRRLDDRMGGVEREVAGLKVEVGTLKDEVGALKDDSNFLKGKLSFVEGYILRRNDPVPAPGE